ncbi:methionyl-tRNA formyltransferase [Patescibacteria group bacterium]
MKIIFYGTPDIAVPFLETLYNDPEIEIVGVVTKPDKPVGRKQEIQAPPVKVKAEEYELEIFQPEKIDSKFVDFIGKYDADFNVVIAYGEIMPTEILDAPANGSLNVHFSLLPKYRGAAPVQTALFNGDKETGVTFMDMEEKLDAGGIYYIKKTPIEDDENAEMLLNRLSEVGAILIPSVLKDISDKVLAPIPQNEDDKSYCKKITKKNAEFNPQKDDASEIMNKFRAFYPWPGLFFIYKGKRCKILKLKTSDQEAKPGELKENEGELILGTAHGSLKINELQLDGKNPMSDKDFINGFL